MSFRWVLEENREDRIRFGEVGLRSDSARQDLKCWILKSWMDSKAHLERKNGRIAEMSGLGGEVRAEKALSGMID